MGNIRHETLNGAKWVIVQKMTMQPLQFVYGMILARLVTPDEIGILGLTGLFFAIASSLKEAGLGAALIRKQDRTETDISTVFWYSLVINLLLAGAFWAIAPWFADFFNQPALVWLTRVSALMMFLNATTGVHYTLYTAQRNFKTPALISIWTSLVSMPVTIYLAFIGWSYWAVMMQGVVSGLLSLISIWYISPWKPKFLFSWASFHEFFNFGFKLSLSGLVWNAYVESRKFVIGKFYTPAQLALYGRADHLCQVPNTLLQAPLNNIIYPILATIQDDTERMDRVYRQYMRLCLCPNQWVMITMACNAESLVHLLYGETWLPCVPYMRVLCFGFAFSTVIRVNHNYLMVKGRSDLMLQREIILRTFGITAMLVGAYFSVIGICIAFVLENILNVLLTVSYTVRISTISAKEQFSDFYPYLLMVLAANIPALLLERLAVPFYICAVAGPLCAFLIYWLLLYLLKDEAYNLIISTFLKSTAGRKLGTVFSRKPKACGN